MGLFDDFDINEEDVKTSSFDIADGVYRFEISDAERRDGSTNKPDNTYFVISFQLEDENGDSAGEKQSWHTLAVDGDAEHRIAKIGWSTLKGLLLSLGIKGSELQDFEGPEIVGVRGTLQLKTGAKKGNKDPYQNIRNIHVDDEDAEEEEALAPKKASKPAAKKAAPAKAKPAKKAPEPEDEGDDEDDDNPFGDD